MKQKNFNSNYLRHLPLLDFTSDFFNKIDLNDTYIICAQHLVSTTYSLFITLLNKGLDPENLSAIGKCYSTDPEAFNEIAQCNIDACPQSLSFDSHAPFDEQYRNFVKQFVLARIQKIKSKRYRKIIVLDDGGELILAVNNFIEDEEVVGIEQTSSGYHKIKKNGIKFPIINVARSSAKLVHESPIIAKLVVDTLVRRMKNLPFQPKEILIIGNGPIGSHIYKTLCSNFKISIFDEVSARSMIQKTEFRASLKKFDLIIGCTGTSVLGLEDYKLLKKNVILVSASSSDREFDAVKLRSKLPHTADCHANLYVDGIYLINCGFPINFAPEYRDIDVDELQLTRSLLLAAILQANSCSSKRKDFIPLNLKNQGKIINKYYSIFANPMIPTEVNL